MGDADQRAGGIEQVDEQQGDDDRDQAELQRAQDVELQEGGGEARRHRNNALRGRDPEHDAEPRGHEDGDDDGAGHAPGIQSQHQDEAERGEDDRRLAHVAERHQRRRMVDDDAGVLQRDDGKEQADAGGDRHLERLRDGVEQPLAHRRDAEQQGQQAGDEHGAQRHLPGQPHALDQAEGEKGIEAHARGRARSGSWRKAP